MNPLLGTAALWPLEFTINQLIKSDQHLQSSLLTFDQKFLQINTVSPSSCISISFSGTTVRLSAMGGEQIEITPTATVSAATSVLIGLLGSSSENALANPQLKIEGDASFVHEFFTCINNLDLRWDDLLAPWLGDLPTQEAKTASDKINRWSSQAAESARNSMNDYLTEESNSLPAPHLVETFTENIDELKLRIDRSAARIERLSKALNT